MSPELATVALVQYLAVEVLKQRVPAATARALADADGLAASLLEPLGGRRHPSALLGQLIHFPDTASAVAFSLQLHRELLQLPYSETLLVHPEAAPEEDAQGRMLWRGLRARVALHHGPVGSRGERMFGPAVYQLGRVAHVGHGGQTLMSESAWRTLRGGLPVNAVLRDLGRHPLAGMRGQASLFQVLPGELDGRRFPEIRSLDRSHRNAPRAVQAMLGRESDLKAVQDLLSLGVRLITLVGPPGVGRSMLAHQLALHPPDDLPLPGGVWLVRPQTSGPHELVRAAADTLAAPLAQSPTLRAAVHQVGRALRALGPTLLVIDGARDAERVIDEWIQLAPQLRIITHHAQRLGLGSEVAYELRQLPAPKQHAARHADAVRVYSQAAHRIGGSTAIDAIDASVVTQALCGNPMSLTLVGGIADRLSPSRLAALVLGQTVGLSDVVSIVHEHLDLAERDLLITCAAFPGTFEREILATVHGARPNDPEPPEVVLERLMRRGLVTVAPSAELPEVERLAVDPRLREAALAGLDPATLDDLRARVTEATLHGLTMWHPFMFGRGRSEVLSRLGMDWPAVISGLAWALEEGRDAAWMDRGARCLLAMEPVLRSWGPLPLHLSLLDRVLARCDAVLGNDPTLQARLLVARADCLLRANDRQAAEADLDRAATLGNLWDDPDITARLALVRGRAALAAGRRDEASEALEAARSAFQSLGDPLRTAVAAGSWGAVALASGRFDDAEAVLVDAARVLRALEARHLLARNLGWLASLYRRTHRPDSARSVCREAIRIHEELGATVAECRVRRELAILDYQLTRYGEATEGLSIAISRARAMGDRHEEEQSLRVLALVALASDDHHTSRAHLLEALALVRERSDGHAEGEVMGWLGVMHHLDEQPDQARGYYRRALEMLRPHREGRLEALFTAWMAELEAEQLQLDVAEQLFASAREALASAWDHQVDEALQILGAPTALAQGVLDGSPETGRQALRQRLKGLDPRTLSGEGRLAFRRARRLASRGLVATTVPPGGEPSIAREPP